MIRACDADVECLCLPKAKFVELCQEFPKSANILKIKAYHRRKQFRKAKEEIQYRSKTGYRRNGSNIDENSKSPDMNSHMKYEEASFRNPTSPEPNLSLPLTAKINPETVIAKAKSLKVKTLFLLKYL